jgi:hypothetical protein
LEEIENAFNVEIISDEFLRKYKNLFSCNTHNLNIEESKITELKHILLDYGRLPLYSRQKRILDTILKTAHKKIKNFLIKYKYSCSYIPVLKFKSKMLLSDKELILCILRNMEYMEGNIIHLDKTELEVEKERIEKSTFNRLLFKYKDLYDSESQTFNYSIIDIIKSPNTNELKNMLINYEHMPLNTNQKQIIDKVLRAIGKRISYLGNNMHTNGMGIMSIDYYKKYYLKMNNKEFALFILKNGRYVNGILRINTEEENISIKLKNENWIKKNIIQSNKTKKHDAVGQDKIIVKVLDRIGNLTIRINNKIIVKKVMSYNIKDNKITININHNKKHFKIIIISIKKGKKSKRYYIYGATKEELENTIITEIGSKKRIRFKGEK